MDRPKKHPSGARPAEEAVRKRNDSPDPRAEPDEASDPPRERAPSGARPAARPGARMGTLAFGRIEAEPPPHIEVKSAEPPDRTLDELRRQHEIDAAKISDLSSEVVRLEARVKRAEEALRVALGALEKIRAAEKDVAAVVQALEKPKG
jgi:hypothetical protein